MYKFVVDVSNSVFINPFQPIMMCSPTLFINHPSSGSWCRDSSWFPISHFLPFLCQYMLLAFFGLITFPLVNFDKRWCELWENIFYWTSRLVKMLLG